MRNSRWLNHLKQRAREIKRNIHALYLACRDPRVPRYAKLFALGVVAYACSPIDLIPDFVPVLGYLDDLVLVPLGVTIAIRLIPPDVMKELREKAEASSRQGRPRSWAAALVFVAIWLLAAVWVGALLYRAVLR